MANTTAFFRSEVWAVLIRCRGQTVSILEARNVKRGGEPMWMDLLMVDVNVSRFLFSSLYQAFWVNINNCAVILSL